MHDQNNVFYAIALSVVVLIAWQYFFATSFLGKPAAPHTSQPKTSQIGSAVSGTGIIHPEVPAVAIPGAQPAEPSSRAQALARSQRIAIDTPRLKGSIALTGGTMSVFLNRGNGTFGPRFQFVALPMNWTTRLEARDLDGNGSPDIVVPATDGVAILFSSCLPAPSCDDANPCTTDSWEVLSQACLHPKVADGTDCGAGHTCPAGVCK